MDGQVVKFVLADLTGGWDRAQTGEIVSYQPTTEVALSVVRESVAGALTTYFYKFGQASDPVLVVGDVIHIPSRFTSAVPGDQVTNPTGPQKPFHIPVDPGETKRL